MSADPLMGAPIAGPGEGASLSGPGVTPPSLSDAGGRFLSDILVELGFVEAGQAEEAVQTARNPGQPTPDKVLLKSGAISEDQLARALAERYGLEHIDLNEFPVDTSAAGLLRQSAAKRYLAAPVGFTDDGALVVAVADPADALGLSDIAVMTKLAVRPAVAARSQVLKLLDTLVFMQEPAPGASQPVSTVIVPPDDTPSEPPVAAVPDDAPAPPGDEAAERELSRLREELALALVARDEALAELATRGEHVESAAAREREEALAAVRAEHERELAAAEAAAEEALRAERGSAQQALAALRAKHEEELAAERARRVDEVEEERARTAAAIDAERERNAKELEALRGRGEEALAEERERHEAALAEERAQHESALADERARHEAALESARGEAAAAVPSDSGRIEQLERELAAAREQVELTADADRRAESARAALAALRDESERQAQVHALTERELKAELEQVRGEVEELRGELERTRAELPETSHK